MVIPSSAWSDSQKAALVQQIISGGLSLDRACADYGLSVDEIKDWVCVFRRSVRRALDRQLRSTLSLQGLEVEELNRPEFSGELTDLQVADLVQTIQLGRKDAKITISHGGGHSYVWCERGEIVDAECGTLDGEPALYRILALNQGSVVADFGASGRPRRISTSTQQLLLEGATRSDRRVRALRRIGDLSLVFGVVSSIAARHARDLGPEELAVLSLFDGHRSIEQILAATELPEHEVLEISAGFLEQGMLRLSLQPITDSGTPPSAGTGSMAMSYRPFVGTVKPEPARPPGWVLASGALLCSSLGAVTAIAYADSLEQRHDESSLPPAAVAGVSSISGPTGALCPSGMVLIRGGHFFMGSDSSHPALQYAHPAHPVSVDSFCMGTHEVTVRDYDACVASGACEPAHDTSELRSSDSDHVVSSTSRAQHDQQCNVGKPGRENDPINCVSQGQARSYCAFRAGRLATEAEWEFAARGESNRLFPWGNTQPTADHVNACGKECARWHEEVGLSSELHGTMYDEDDGYAGTAPVGSYPLGATSDGVLDLIGNVFEWTSGGLYAYERSPRSNPRGPSNSGSYVIRGGNFNSGTPEFSDPALRFAMAGDSYSHGVGIRCASDPEFGPVNPAGKTAAGAAP
jgi:sulfatase modifying factor 1